MLLVNLTTIYQCNIPTLNHTQDTVDLLARLQLKYTLTGELDPHIAEIISLLSNTTALTATPHSNADMELQPAEHPLHTHT